MNFKNFLAIILTSLIIFSTIPVSASQNEVFIEFIDITSGYEKGAQALTGEAKVLVRAHGLEGNATIAQTAISFSGNLKYKGIQYLIGENKYPECFLYYPDAAYANFTGEIIPAVVTNSEYTIPFEEAGTDLFILTFYGNPGESVDLMLDSSDSYYILDDEYFPSESASVSASAALSGVEKKTATIRLTMDKVTTFAQMSAAGYSDSNIILSITDETDEYTLSTVLNNILISDGGHRDGSKLIPTFEVSVDVVPDKTYTVSLSGPGYVPYEKEGVTFDTPLELTNADFIPGDVNGDKSVGVDDKELCTQAVSDESVSEKFMWATDINRDGVVNDDDLSVFVGIEDSGDDDDKPETDKAAAPGKMESPDLDAGNEKITVKWKKPADGGSEITGYVINYGTRKSELGNRIEISKASDTEYTLKNLKNDTTYYVTIAAVNKIGQGEFSDISSSTTPKSDKESNKGSGGGGGGGGGGSTPVITPDITPVPTTPSNPDEPFTDLADYEWAKSAVYSLMKNGIVNGTSANTYSPSANIKRGDFILILTRMIEMGEEDIENFSDVPSDSYYASAISKAKRAGIAKGSGNEFYPESSITRQDLITLAYRAFLNAGLISETTDYSALDQFTDKESIADYALAPMASMVASGIIKGSDGNVNPNGNATRAEVAVMCERLMNLKN